MTLLRLGVVSPLCCYAEEHASTARAGKTPWQDRGSRISHPMKGNRKAPVSSGAFWLCQEDAVGKVPRWGALGTLWGCCRLGGLGEAAESKVERWELMGSVRDAVRQMDGKWDKGRELFGQLGHVTRAIPGLRLGLSRDLHLTPGLPLPQQCSGEGVC